MPIESRPQSPYFLPWQHVGHASMVQADGSLGSPIKMPSTIEAELRKTSTYIETLAAEISVTRGLDSTFLDAWAAFLKEWRTWYGSGGVWFFGEGPSTLWGSTWDTAQEYGRRAEQFRASFVAAGGKTGTPSEVTPPEPDNTPELSSTIKWVVAGIAIVAVAYVAGPLVRGAGKATTKS